LRAHWSCPQWIGNHGNFAPKAKKEYLITSLDTVWDATGKWMKTLAPCLRSRTSSFPASDGAGNYRTHGPKRCCALAAGLGCETVGLKLGCKGCYVLSADGEVTAPSFKVNAVDGTGSGDAWDAGFLCGVLNRWDIERTRCLQTQLALCVMGLGATAGVKSMAETQRFIARAGAEMMQKANLT